MSIDHNINNLFTTAKSRPRNIAACPVRPVRGTGLTVIDTARAAQRDQIRPWGSGLISIGDIKFWLKVNEEAFKETLIKALWHNGVAVTFDLRIYLAGDNVLVKGDIVNKVKIEAVINGHAALYGHFLLLAATDSFIAAIDTNSDFAANYSANPEEAITNFCELYSADRWHSYLLSTSNLMGPISGSIN